MQALQPRFGAILVQKLTTGTTHYPDMPVKDFSFQVTDKDKKTFAPLLDSAKSDQIRLYSCDVQSGGFDRQFRIGNQRLNFSEDYSSGERSNYAKEATVKLVIQFINALPVTDEIKTGLLDTLKKHSGYNADGTVVTPKTTTTSRTHFNYD